MQRSLIVSGCNVTAVASKSPSRAKSFAHHFSVPIYHTTYESLASDPNVDIVYIATTNEDHLYPSMLMLLNRKNVLVEKPTTVRYNETNTMYEEAKNSGLFLMTNHWTRFFPLIKYLRQTFLTSSNGNTAQNSTLKQTINHDFRLGKVLAMHGDFSFPTPINPSDRYLNRTLGGGVTLDVGCYLIELALLAAYDHRQSASEKIKTSVEYASLHPNGIDATGHGIMYNGIEFPVDVESSFSLRWGGGRYGVWNGECSENNLHNKCEAVNIGGKTAKTLKHHEAELEPQNEFTMIASFQASFRRPSSFEVEYVFENGRIVIHGPGNCPNEMTVYEYEPHGSLKQEKKIYYALPPIKNEMDTRFGIPYYPRAEGFAYVIDAIEECMARKGIPGRDKFLVSGGCLELEENTINEQLVTVEVTENVLKDMGYFG